jgi:hypothetical protein
MLEEFNQQLTQMLRYRRGDIEKLDQLIGDDDYRNDPGLAHLVAGDPDDRMDESGDYTTAALTDEQAEAQQEFWDRFFDIVAEL